MEALKAIIIMAKWSSIVVPVEGRPYLKDYLVNRDDIDLKIVD
jgi:hypothetical protein